MAEHSPREVTPCYEAPHTVAKKAGSPPGADGGVRSTSGKIRSRRISPVGSPVSDIEAGSVKSVESERGLSSARSSFSFSPRLPWMVAPDSPGTPLDGGTNGADGTVRSFSMRTFLQSKSLRISPARSPVCDIQAGSVKSPESEFLSSAQSSFSFSPRLQHSVVAVGSPEMPLDGSTAPQTTTERSSNKEAAPTHLLHLRPAQNGAKALEPLPHPLPLPPTASSPASGKEGLQSPSVRDFQYRPKVDDTYYPSKKYDLGPQQKPSQRSKCFLWCITISLFVVIVLGVGVTVITVEMRPKSPSLTIGNIVVTNLNFTDGDAAQLETGMQFSLNLTNPNKHARVIYSHVSARVFFKELLLNNITVPGFNQGKGIITTSLSGDLPNKTTTVPSDTIAGLKGEIASSDHVLIELSCLATGKYKILGYKMNFFSVDAYCQMGVTPGGAGGPAAIISQPSCFY